MNARTMNQVKRNSNKYRYEARESGTYAGNAFKRRNIEKERRMKRRREEEKRQEMIHAA